jgi:glycosyltransferase involved in cell wall biosynthesis
MKIAQIAPLMESVPPRLYGGTERVVSYLSEELVRQGHEVTLFASGDSMTSARLMACTDQAIRLNPAVQDHIPHYMIMLDKLRRSAHLFDVLHFHIDALHFPLFRDLAARTITTLHGRQDLPDLLALYRAFPEMPLVSISGAQRGPIADANFARTIYHGLPVDLLTPNYQPRGGYLAFLGRISCEKRPDRAIAIANALGLPLKIAAKVDKADEAYFREVIAASPARHLLQGADGGKSRSQIAVAARGVGGDLERGALPRDNRSSNADHRDFRGSLPLRGHPLVLHHLWS